MNLNPYVILPEYNGCSRYAPRGSFLCFLVALLTIGLPVAQEAAAELAVVRSRSAVLYQDSKEMLSLARGQILSSFVHGGDERWLVVTYADDQYLARKSAFRTESELRRVFQRDLVRNETRLALVKDEIRTYSKETENLINYIFQVKWDRNIFYRIALSEFTTAIDNQTGSESKVLTEPVEGERKYRYVQKITAYRARELRKAWQRRLRQTEEVLDDLRSERTELELKLLRDRLEFVRLSKSFRQYEAAAATYQDSLYMVNGSKVGLYNGSKKVNDLKKGDIIRAHPSKQNRHRLEILSGGTTYDTPVKSYRSKSDLFITHTETVLSLELKARILAERREFIQQQELLYARYIPDLVYGAPIAGEFIPFRPQHWNITIPRGLYTKRLFPTDGTQVAHGERARNSIERWREEMYQLHTVRLEMEREEMELERQVLEAKESYEAISQRFAMNER